MIVKSIQLVNFRNHREVSLELALKNLVRGDNGRGKTNLLDAIYMVVAPQQKISVARNVSFNESQARATLKMARNGATTTAEVILSGQGKRYRENKKSSASRGAMPAVYFGPEDLAIIAGPPSERRKFINQIGCSLSAKYARATQELRRALKQKNTLLRQERPTREIEPWNKKIAQTSALIYKSRHKICVEIAIEASEMFDQLCGAELALIYCPQVKETSPEAEYIGLIKANEKKERLVKKAMYGSHMDNVEIKADGVDLTVFGSHGQQRLVAFVLRMAQANLFERRLGIRPLILLDDLKSELDAKHKEAVEELLIGPSQVIATSTENCYGRGFKQIEL